MIHKSPHHTNTAPNCTQDMLLNNSFPTSSVTGQDVNANTSTLVAEKTRDLSLQLQPSPQTENIQWNIHKTLKPWPKVT
jgi:hypothetical protein